VGDMNGDGAPDVATVDHADAAHVLLNDGDGTLAPAQDYPIGAGQGRAEGQAIVLADFDGDGAPDLVAPTAGGALALLRNHGDGSFAPALQGPVVSVA